MRPQDPVQVEIAELNKDGYGEDREHQLAVFGALPGEMVTARPFTRKRRKLYAKAIAVEHPSSDRVVPMCPAADYCGGCSFQHLDPGRQILFKQEQLLAALGTCQPASLFPPMTGPVRNYRTKARLGVKFVEKKGRVLVGFREKMAPFIAEIDRCDVLAEPLDSLIPDLAALIGALDARSSIPQIEAAVAEDKTALVFRHLQDLADADLARLREFGAEFGVDMYLQPKGPDSTHRIFAVAGPDDSTERLHYTLPAHELRYEFHPLDFTQVNQPINRSLVDLAIGELQLTSDDRVLDLFCGIGNFSLPVAKRCLAVLGVEGAGSCVQRARANASANGIDNCAFLEADLFEPGAHFHPNFKGNKVLLDPPRSGALEVCKTLASNKVERVVYVSCNPLTLARDAQMLVESGYRLDKAGVIDMFPHTTHVESIACFSH